MIKEVRVYGLDEVLAARRSFNSQAVSDSNLDMSISYFWSDDIIIFPSVDFGPKDLALLKKLKGRGDSHAKVNRFVTVTFSLKLPRRVWVDFDTYRIGREEIRPDDLEYMSDSTMHTLGKECLTLEDFSPYTSQAYVDMVNEYLIKYKQSPNESTFMELKDHLGEGFLQERRIKANYQSLRHIYLDRKNHRQPEFREFCKWIERLPYAEYFIL